MYNHYQHFLESLEHRLKQLEKENMDLKQRMEQLKPMHIENINYKIQELVVKELKGTLNIGMSALTDPQEIKKWLQESEGEEIELHDLEQSPEENEEL